MKRTFPIATAICGAAVIATSICIRSAHGQSPASPASKTVWDGVYTADQAARGLETFKARCAKCHGETMMGGGGTPAAAGPEMVFGWKDKKLGELFDYVKAEMPPDLGGSLTDQLYLDCLAAILKASDFPAGSVELKPDEASWKDTTIVATKR